MTFELLKSAFSFLQKIGKALMLPVAVLPVAGILLGVGTGLLNADISWLPNLIPNVMRLSGSVIFENMPLIFAIGTALGLSNNDGASALAAVCGYLVMLATMGAMANILWLTETAPGTFELGFMAKWLGYDLTFAQKIISQVDNIKTIDTGVFGGLFIGVIASIMFNKYYRINLPSYLGFFAGKRFVPIVTCFAAIGIGVVLSFIWPPIQEKIDWFSHWAAYSNPTLAGAVYGFVERLLLPFGLHHIWNAPFFFEIGEFTTEAGKIVNGDINRFFAGDPTAGILSGGFLIKMFGLPAAAYAIYICARPENKIRVGGIMVSAALTAFLTGITEPLEFAFLFAAPFLYFVHAVLTGTAFALMNFAGAHIGYTFSQGTIDFILYYAIDTRPWLVFIFGPVYAVLYFGIFTGLIKLMNLKTVGREDVLVSLTEEITPQNTLTDKIETARQLVKAFGGRKNIKTLDACITRLRLEVNDKDKVNKTRLKELGASGVMEIGNNIQAVFGPLSENLKSNMEEYLRITKEKSGLENPEADGYILPKPMLPENIKDALGGAINIDSVTAEAQNKFTIKVKNTAIIDEAALKKAGVKTMLKTSSGTVHILF